MEISRRGFLSAFMGALILDPEKLLWIPGQKTIIIPKQTIPELGIWAAQWRDMPLTLHSKQCSSLDEIFNAVKEWHHPHLATPNDIEHGIPCCFSNDLEELR